MIRRLSLPMEEFINLMKRLVIGLLIATGLIALVEMILAAVRMARRQPEYRFARQFLIAIVILLAVWLVLRFLGYF